MAVMTLAASKGTQLVIEISGEDEIAMEKAVVDLINNRFGEAE